MVAGLYSAVSSPPTDSAIAPRVLAVATSVDDTRWFIEELQPHEAGLRRWLRRRFPRLTDIDDLIQDTYVRVLHARGQGRVAHAKSYLFVTARNAACDQVRRLGVVEIEAMDELASLPVADDVRDAGEALAHHQELAILAAAIEALPPRCRLVVKLRKLRGLGYQEIAAQLGISAHTVNAQLAKGMILCREYLRAKGLQSHE